MKGNFIRINIMLSKNRSNQLEKQSLKNEAKNLEFFIFFKKRLGKDFLLDRSWFVYTLTLQKCKKPHSNIILVSNLTAGLPTILRNVGIWVRKLRILSFLTNFTMGN